MNDYDEHEVINPHPICRKMQFLCVPDLHMPIRTDQPRNKEYGLTDAIIITAMSSQITWFKMEQGNNNHLKKFYIQLTISE